MQTTYRRLDTRGRISIPKSFRDALFMDEDETVKIVQIANKIIIETTEPKCIFCGQKTNMKYKMFYICTTCANEIQA